MNIIIINYNLYKKKLKKIVYNKCFMTTTLGK